MVGVEDVPETVVETIEAIRLSGETNPLDIDTVQVLAYERGAHETVVWLEENQEKYKEFLGTWERS